LCSLTLSRLKLLKSLGNDISSIIIAVKMQVSVWRRTPSECVSISCVARRDYFGARSATCDMASERKMRGAARRTRLLSLFQQLMHSTREIALQKAINWTVMCFVCFLLSAAA
jgi:hypothetical protein